MNPKPIGLPIWAPLFVLFLLFLATVWVTVNRHGLLEMYHQQVHGLEVAKKEGECRKEGLLNLHHKRSDQSINPLKTFLSWPERQRTDEKLAKGGCIWEEGNGQEEMSINQVEDPLFEDKMEPHLTKDEDFDHKQEFLDHEYLQHFDQDQDQDQDQELFDDFKASKAEMDSSPLMDYKREFASDEANPYVESLQQRYEPLPNPYSD
ncbi:uncharacterized protein LOC108095284 isoform X2 [Drosophila ficusphila]|uniref:uncharacterized protein LOC108095284 isoform X2 n=1 Tax=Drosophila ficusphila TaxID=30025 RepID=UPI0007E680F9|nr:uncharacterized protein LOC108095284 isoform X2 [Drosophila ficusphila]